MAEGDPGQARKTAAEMQRAEERSQQTNGAPTL